MDPCATASEPATPPREPAWPGLVLHATALALCLAGLRLAVFWVHSPFAGNWAYVAGVVQGLGIALLWSLVASAPLLLGPRRWWSRTATVALSTLLLLAAVAASHYHAVFNRLPSAEALAYLGDHAVRSSLAARVSTWWIAGILAPPLLLQWALPRLARRPRVAAVLTGRRRTVALTLALLVVASAGRAATVQGQARFGATGPLANLLLSVARGRAAIADAPRPRNAALDLVQRLTGVQNAGPPRDPAFPYCTAHQPGRSLAGKRRSAIVLVLESVDARALALEVGGQPVMPNLRRIAREGVHFRNFFAAGAKSRQALPALFAGIPALPFRDLLKRAPMPHFDGLPAALRGEGFETAYFHGADLSFEQQRRFLERAGFTQIFEPDPLGDAKVLGWGLPDGEAFRRLRGWLSRRRAAGQGGGPFLAALFTLSTHDPYRLPSSHRRRFSTRLKGELGRLAEALAYLDDALGRFHRWYVTHERGRGTLLVLTGDHAPRVPWPTDPSATSSGELEHRFRVPLIIEGLSASETGRARHLSDRHGGHHDLPQTLLGLLGIDRPGCYQGRDLLGTERPWPGRRLIVSTAGEQLELLYVRDGRLRWLFDLHGKRVAAHDTVADPRLQRDVAAGHPRRAAVGRFVRAYTALGRYLASHDGFAPRAAPAPRRAAIERPADLIVSHRGRARGPGRAAPPDNSLAAIEAAAAAGFAWVEVDVQLTSDMVPVLHHDREIALRDGRKVPITLATLERLRALPLVHQPPTLAEALARYRERIGFCVELKSQVDVFRHHGLARAVLRVLGRHGKSGKVIVDSFSHGLLATIERFSSWPTGFDLPQRPVQGRWLEFAVERGFEWIYVEARFASREVIARAHRLGLRVMVYGVDDRPAMQRLAPLGPDGVITGVAELAGWHRPLP